MQARSHARAVPRVRPIREVRVAGRDPARAGALAAELAGELGIEVRASATYAEALDGAAIACARPCTRASPSCAASGSTPART